MAKIILDEIIEAFIFHKPKLKAQEIKDYVFKQRGDSFEGYQDRYSFDNTIQRIVEKHCSTKKGFNGLLVFESPSTGYYQLTDHKSFVEMWKDDKVDNQILRLAEGTQLEDFEMTRTLREVNIIDRNKNLVIGLKSLYNNTCQLCGTKLKISENVSYSEVHHIKPLGKPHNGPDTTTNMLVVCPNCHVLLDFKAIMLFKDKLIFKTPHRPDNIFIEYHNNRII